MQNGDLVFNTRTKSIVRFNQSMDGARYIDLADSTDPVSRWVAGNWRNRWKDETVVCLASGSSTTQQQLKYLEAAHKKGLCKVIVVNRSYQQAPYADVLFAKDAQWWDGYSGEWNSFSGEKWTVHADTARKYQLNYAQYQVGKSDHTLCKTHLRDENSGHLAINLAYLFGAKKIILLGYEMNPLVKKIHFFGLHDERKGLENPTPEIFNGWIEKMNALAESMDIPVFNCSINTAITGFKPSTLEEVLL